MEETKTQQRRKVNNDFFSIGASKNGNSRLDEDEENRNETWRNIKPHQNVDALNREMFKKRKYEEYR